jgi:hypothetical protein
MVMFAPMELERLFADAGLGWRVMAQRAIVPLALDQECSMPDALTRIALPMTLGGRTQRTAVLSGVREWDKWYAPQDPAGVAASTDSEARLPVGESACAEALWTVAAVAQGAVGQGRMGFMDIDENDLGRREFEDILLGLCGVRPRPLWERVGLMLPFPVPG